MSYKISCIVTCHNLEDYLKECIDSIKAQITTPFEIILVHDGCSKFITYGGVDTILIDKNVGVARSRMMGAKQATGDYLLFIDADDKIIETYIQEMVNRIKEGNEIVYPDCVLWSSWGDSGMKNAYQRMPNKINFGTLIKQNWVLVSSLIPRKLFFDLGGFKEYPLFEDWEFFLRAVVHKTPFKKARTYLSYRQRTQSRNHQSDVIKVKTTNQIKADIHKYESDTV